MTKSPATMVPNSDKLDSITVIRHVLIADEGFYREKVAFSVTWPPGCVSISSSCLIIITLIILIQEQDMLYLKKLLKNSRPAELKVDYKHLLQTPSVGQGMPDLEVRLVIKLLCHTFKF